MTPPEPPEVLPPPDGPLDQVLADAVEGVVDLIEHGLAAPDRLAASCAALRELAPALFTFFDHAVTGALSPEQIGIEARAWQGLALKRWPPASPTAQRTLAALAALADGRGSRPGPAPGGEPPPENRLERAVLAARADPSRRREVWEALLTGTVHLAVVDYELDPDRQAALTFLGRQLEGVAHTFAFTSAGRLQRLLDDAGSHLLSVEATGEELTRFWSANTWLVLNPGTELAFVLSPAEVKCLPSGPRVVLPRLDEVSIHPVAADAAAEARLARAAASVGEVERIVAARVVLRSTGADLPNPVAVVRLRAGADPAAVLPVLDERCAAAGAGGWLALPERADDAFAAAAAASGRVLYVRDG